MPVRTALVTGAAKRIGRAIALALAEDGYALALHHNASGAEAEKLAAAIRAQGGRAATVAADLADPRQTDGLVAAAVKAAGPLTVLVNNASLFERDTLADLSPGSWERNLAVNLRAPVFLAQAFARQLPAGVQGNVVNLIDQKVLNLTPYYLSYTAAKMGLWAMTQTLAQELAPAVRVNGIGPGPTLPNPTQTEAEFRAYAGKMPLGHGPTPEEIARVVLFILDTPSLTGHMIPVDGGEHLGFAHPKRREPS
jgi:NAD(P)-dependent dehydrogenase (short-subunit alcohol dehydrogenase family)